MLLRHSLGLTNEAQVLESAVAEAVTRGIRTPDIAAGMPPSTTGQAGEAVAKILAEK
jgi:3-isopropylmalate dehydrogenase